MRYLQLLTARAKNLLRTSRFREIKLDKLALTSLNPINQCGMSAAPNADHNGQNEKGDCSHDASAGHQNKE
jgi:hypothetical protein